MTEYTKEIYRKIFHMLLILLPVAYFFYSKKQILFFLLPAAFLVVGLDYLRNKSAFIRQKFSFLFGKIMREAEHNELTGASYFMMTACIAVLCFNKIFVITAFTILAISDALAALVGKAIKSQPFFEKSFAGSSAFFLSAMIIILVIAKIFQQNLAFHLFATLAVFATTIVEARPSLFKISDNMTIPLTFCFTMLAFNLIWSFS